jgi:ankyrin repeat protein
MRAKTTASVIAAATLLLVISAPASPVAFAAEIHDAAAQGDLSAVKKWLTDDLTLLDARDEEQRTPLHWACRGVHADLARYLIEAGADVNAKDVNLVMPLHSVASRGHAEVAALLIENGAVVDSPDYEDHTALHYAARGGHSEAAALLVAKGADLEARNSRKRTPLLLAARESGDPQTARVLIAAGADVNTADRGGQCLLRDSRASCCWSPRRTEGWADCSTTWQTTEQI